MAGSNRLDEGAETTMKEKINRMDVEFVRVEMCDMNGVSRGILIDADYYLEKYKNGFDMTLGSMTLTSRGDITDDTGFGEEQSYRNATLYPDINTFRHLPWTDKTASVLADMRTENYHPESPYIACSPRAICKNQIDKLHDIGFSLYSAFEFEFYLLNKDTKTPSDKDFNYSAMQNAHKYENLMRDIMRNMKKIGIIPEGYHSELGPSQQEVTYKAAFGITGADNAFRYKQLAKEVSHQHSHMATFMSMPFPDISGSSGHFNHSLWGADGKNAFYDPDERYGLSKVAQHWLAGIMHHTNALLCLASSTPNCYERTNQAAFAPCNNMWGLDNRSLAYRVKNNSTERIYLENRLSPAAVNPYLLTAGTIIAGLDGIKNKMPLKGDPHQGSITDTMSLADHIKPLPKSLSEALDCLLNSTVFVDELGPEFIRCFSAIKRLEEKLAGVKRGSDELYKWYMDYYGVYI